MKVFRYTAINPAGFRIHGELLAATVDEACVALSQINVVPLRCKVVGLSHVSLLATVVMQLEALVTRYLPVVTLTTASPARVSEHLLQQFTADLATLLQTGLPLTSAVEQIGLANGDVRISKLAFALKLSITEGLTFSQALRQFPGVVPAYYISVIEVAESSGKLDQELAKLAAQIQSRLQFRQRIRRAMTYPSLVLLLLALLVAFLVSVVIPSLGAFMQELDQGMPWYTQMLMDLSDWLRSYAPSTVLALLFLLAATAMLRRVHAGFRLFSDQSLLRVPLLGSLLLDWHTARFCRDLASLYSTGIDLLSALKIVEPAGVNRYLQVNTLVIRRQVEEGVALAGAMRSSGLFAADCLQLMRLAEASGNYTDALQQVARLATTRLSNRIESIERSVGPLMMLVTGLLILWIIVSVIEPIYNTAISAGGVL